ncbi:MAG: deoxyguanosinetriphosphate triphosphohydrolase [Planctomycetota bacterium]|nr:deoxyguanosinetriphosphate triphosphohydrolase [Planctomycetota bacterium]
MRDRAELERHLEAALSPCAMRASDSRGRPHADDEPPYRGVFQRDRDRIVHCAAFRRLEYKTQVFISVLEGDHHRNRLTHTMEVTQIARTIARALALNEDLVEALALAHDLGHGPFGHSGEDALNEVMQGHGGFNHNLQGLRVVDKLERRYADFPGLNLSYETREGFTKNLNPQGRAQYGFTQGESPPLEVQLVGHADEIAYDTHDIEDGLVSGVLHEDGLRDLALWRETEAAVLDEQPVLEAEQRLRWRSVVRRLIRTLVGDLMAETEKRLSDSNVRSLAEVRTSPRELVGFSLGLEFKKRDLETFLHSYFYNHAGVRKHTALWQERLKDIYAAYLKDPSRLPPDHVKRVDKEGETIERVICDYVAGMTDRFAETQWERYCKA